MNLFDETENKYYEFISYLLLRKKSFTSQDIDRFLLQLYPGERDFEVEDVLFSKKNEENIFFHYQEGRYLPMLPNAFPVRCSLIEQQSLKSLLKLRYIRKFLSEGTIRKLEQSVSDVPEEWSFDSIKIKNQFDTDTAGNDDDKIRLIAEAIRKSACIFYDNVKPHEYAFHQAEVFPVKIEYSFLNDVFWVCAYVPSEQRFIKMTLDTMSDIRIGEEIREDLQQEYGSFLDERRTTMVLDVEPANNVIERCFRIFSYYERKAVYNREEDRYRLEIVYYDFDEAEVIRDILSLGSQVTVLKPSHLRKRIAERIRKASLLYENREPL